MRRLIVSLLVNSVFLLACTQEKKEDGTIIYLEKRSHIDREWSDFFIEENEKKFDFSDSTHEILAIRSFLINQRGDFIIPDGVAKQIRLFSRAGNFVQNIGKWGGQGPGEFEIPSAMVLHKDNLWIFDIAGYRLTQYNPPHYEFSKSYQLKTAPSSFLFTPEQRLITYSFKDDAILSLWDLETNRLLKQEFRPSEQLRLFVQRYNLGGIVDHYRKGFLMVYPEKYEVRFYNYDLEPLRLIRTKEHSKFRPTTIEYPKSLPTNTVTDEHTKWWSQFLHIARVYSLTESVIGITLIDSNDESTSTQFLNIYSLDGKVYAEGLVIPHQGFLRHVYDGHIYVVRPARVDSEGELLGPKIYEYKLREDLFDQ